MTAALGGVLAAGVAGAAAGATAGSLINKIPSICSLLCKPADWTEVHPNVYFEKKKALLEKATLSCLLGGLVTIKMPNLQLAIDMGLLAGEDVYCDNKGEIADKAKNGKSDATPEQLNRIGRYNRVLPEEIQNKLKLDPSDFNDNDGSGFYAQLYKTDDNNYFLVYRGTEGKLNDIKEDGLQGVGISSEQYDKSTDLARKVNEKLKGKNLTIAGHSLGGGLAAIAGGATGRPTYTYNAAGVHNTTLSRNNVHRSDMNHVQAYNASDDPLNKAQDNREKILGKLGWVGGLAYLTGGLPRASGQRMEIETDVGIVKGHTAIHIVNQLEKELAAMGGGNSSVIAKNK